MISLVRYTCVDLLLCYVRTICIATVFKIRWRVCPVICFYFAKVLQP